MTQKFQNLLNAPRALAWLVVVLILIGAVRIDRVIEKGAILSFISSDPDEWSLIGASAISHELEVSQTSPSETVLAPQELHTSGQAMVQSPSGINYIAGRTHTRSSNGGTVQSIVIFKFDNSQVLPSAQTELVSGGYDRVSSMAIATNGDVIIAGHTTSDSFPGVRLNDAIANTQTHTSHTSKLFVARYSPDLKLLTSSVLGGKGHVIPQDVLIHPNGLVYMTGSTNSEDFITTPGTFSSALSAAETPLIVDYGADSFVIALDSDLKTIAASTLIGGNRDDYAYRLDLDANGNIIVGGNTGSTNFLKTIEINTSASLSPQFSNIFISIFDPHLTTLLASSVWGSPTSDYLRALHVDNGGSLHLCGHTTSDAFPVTSSFVDNTMKGGHYDAWYAQIDQNLKSVQRASYVGGKNNDYCNDVSSANDGSIYLAIDTNSNELLGRSATYPGRRLQGGLIAKIEPSISPGSKEDTIDLIAAFRSGSYTSIKDLTVGDQTMWVTGYSEAEPTDQFISIGAHTVGQPRLIFAQIGPN
jgi:hypothetical protein